MVFGNIIDKTDNKLHDAIKLMDAVIKELKMCKLRLQYLVV